MASLIQQRTALDRQRAQMKLHAVISGFFMVLGLAGVVLTGTHGSGWYVPFVIGLMWLILAIVQHARTTTAVKAFEAEHGLGAGKQ
jgi:fatty acid desaturase